MTNNKLNLAEKDNSSKPVPLEFDRWPSNYFFKFSEQLFHKQSNWNKFTSSAEFEEPSHPAPATWKMKFTIKPVKEYILYLKNGQKFVDDLEDGIGLKLKLNTEGIVDWTFNLPPCYSLSGIWPSSAKNRG